MIKLKIDDIIYVTGRGNIICCETDREDFHINDTVITDTISFNISGIERMRSKVGIILYPNIKVPDTFIIGGDLYIKTQE